MRASRKLEGHVWLSHFEPPRGETRDVPPVKRVAPIADYMEYLTDNCGLVVLVERIGVETHVQCLPRRWALEGSVANIAASYRGLAVERILARACADYLRLAEAPREARTVGRECKLWVE